MESWSVEAPEPAEAEAEAAPMPPPARVGQPRAKAIDDTHFHYPANQDELDALSYGDRVAIARATQRAIAAGRIPRAVWYDPALDLLETIPVDAPERADADQLVGEFELLRPSVDDIVEATAPEGRLDQAMLLVRQVFDHPDRTDLLDAAQKFIDAIPFDASPDPEKLRTAQAAIVVLRVNAHRNRSAVPGAAKSGPDLASGASISADTGYQKTVHVRGYLKADGTYVGEHYRSAPRR